MTQITVLPHPDFSPEGAIITGKKGDSLCETLLEAGIEIEHACGKVGACTTCHVIVKEGFASLSPADELEEDMLDKAWGLSPYSRLSCQAIVGDTPLTVDIPKYSINHAREEG